MVKQSCVNCVHYIDKWCCRWMQDVEHNATLAGLCANFEARRAPAPAGAGAAKDKEKEGTKMNEPKPKGWNDEWGAC